MSDTDNVPTTPAPSIVPPDNTPAPPTSSRNTTSHHSTPLAVRISSMRLFDSNTSIHLGDLSEMLKSELKGAILKDSKSLIGSLFADAYLPFPVNDQLLASLTSVYNNNSWIEPPPTTERLLVDWLNNLGDTLSVQQGVNVTRRFDARFCNTYLKGSPIERKPDIILLSNPSSMPEWHEVDALCEVTSQSSFHTRLQETVKQKTFIMFTTQPSRRYVLGISFVAQRFRLTLCDRAGIVQSISHNINDALPLLRVLTALMFGSDTLIGYDPSMRRGANNRVISITVGQKEYEVIEILFRSETLRGRGTHCFRVKRGGQQYVIKDCWIQTGRAHSEIEILGKIAGVQGVPTLIYGEDLKLPCGKMDSTNLHRDGMKYDEERIHRRLLMQPVAEPIQNFKSKKELIGAFIDIIKGEYLYSRQET